MPMRVTVENTGEGQVQAAMTHVDGSYFAATLNPGEVHSFVGEGAMSAMEMVPPPPVPATTETTNQ